MMSDENCDYVADSLEPCKDCPRRLTALYRCELLKESLKQTSHERRKEVREIENI